MAASEESNNVPTQVLATTEPGLTGAQILQLLKHLTDDRVSHRSQGKTTLSYVEAWDIKRTLIRIFGFANFSADVIEAKVHKVIEEDRPVMNWDNGRPTGPKMVNGVPEMKHYFTVLAQCTVRLEILATGATYTESAAASQTGPDIGEVTDFAIKTAESDALKRAAIYLGTQFGLSLYNDGALADVVLTVLEPGQKQALEVEIKERAQRAAERAAQDGAPADAPQANGPQKAQRPVGKNPEAADGRTAPQGPNVRDAFQGQGNA